MRRSGCPAIVSACPPEPFFVVVVCFFIFLIGFPHCNCSPFTALSVCDLLLYCTGKLDVVSKTKKELLKAQCVRFSKIKKNCE